MASYNSIDYLLRPSKQVERKLIIETIMKLSSLGYRIHDYTYMGMGSIYYADFVMFHKYLLIEEMICVESDYIPLRMKFNKPYDFIKLYMKPVSEVIPLLDRNKKHFIWLDYDSYLSKNELSDISSCLSTLAKGSIFLITIQCDPINLNKLINPTELKSLSEEEKNIKSLEYLNSLLQEHLGREIEPKDKSKNKLPIVYATAIRNFIDTNVSKRKNLIFNHLFNFVYADGVQMLTLGGILDEPSQSKLLKEDMIYELSFLTDGNNPVKISVPPLTLREKGWIEQNLVKNPNPPEILFEIDKNLLDNFIKYYRQYPFYYETLL